MERKLIYADELADALKAEFNDNDDPAGKVMIFQGAYWHHGRVMSVIEDAEAVDAIEVVRCRNCRFWLVETIFCDGRECRKCGRNHRYTHEDDYCSCGERKWQ